MTAPIEFWLDFGSAYAYPLTASGKIQKFVLRDRFVAGELRARNADAL